MKTRNKLYGSLAAIITSFIFVSFATAAPIIFTLDDNTHSGSPSEVKVTVDQAGSDLLFQVNVIDTNTGNTGDLRGLFFQIADENLLTSGSFSVSGSDVTDFQFGPINSVKKSWKWRKYQSFRAL